MAKQKKLHNRDFEWGSYRGRIKVKDMGETHLVNVTHMMKKRRDDFKNSISKTDMSLSEASQRRLKELNTILKTFYAEMRYRDIPKAALKNAPYEFQAEDGSVKVWDYEARTLKTKPSSIRFIVEE